MYRNYLFIIISLKKYSSLYNKGQKFGYSRDKTDKFVSEYGGVYARIFLY
jgi:hypothetical protein